MSIISKSFSALSKLGIVVLLLLSFLGGLAGVVYMSLSGAELTVPEIVGKDFLASEKELAALGLKIKKRADRVSSEPMNTVLEQLPKAGETVKTGQMILVVVSKAGTSEEEAPPSLKKDIETDDSEKIEEMISDKPKKSRSNSNTNKKKADTTRDVIANESDSAPANDSKETTSPKSDDQDKKDSNDKKDTSTGNPPKPQNSPAARPDNDPQP